MPEKKGVLVIGVTRIVSNLKETQAINKEALLVYEFMTAYTQLRMGATKGDLRIHLSVEGSPEECGVTFLDEPEEAASGADPA